MKKNNKDQFSVIKNNSSKQFKKSGKYILENKNMLIEKRKKKRLIRRSIIAIIILIAILITLALKLPYFNISEVEITGNKVISVNQIEKLANIPVGSNIFYFNTEDIKNNIMRNPYILDVQVKRIFPKKIQVTVHERSAEFYLFNGSKYFIIDSEGIVLEKRVDIDDMNLVKLLGFLNFDKAKIGEVIPNIDERKIKLISEITELIHNNKSGINISTVNLGDMTELGVYINSMKIKLGTSEKLQYKLNRGLNIFAERNLENTKGYIDVSFEGNPVVFFEE